MKFVALALTLVFAVGSQAASLPDDASQYLATARAVMDVYLTQLKDSTVKALEQIDDPSLKAKLVERVDNLHTQIKAAQGAVAPMTDTVVGTVFEGTADFRGKINADVEALKLELVPLRSNLETIVNKHLEDYKTLLGPTLQEYSTMHNTGLEMLKTKLEPLLPDLKQKIETNVEETKVAMIPIVEAVRAKVTEWVEGAKGIADPYVEEYKDKIGDVITQLRSITQEDMAALNTKVTPLAQEITVKLNEIMETIASTISKA
ncbi:apolipoprotein A-Ib [Labrus mixtus]|uniref:apolipoprotein A-Ib n=1 Tax=Labrus mixtus TaxID=508554 RepID=UPI0029C0F627|nr:apolipoprotein A-Ib [Labrus mixtus]